MSGSPINGGFLKFFDTGTSAPKSVFADSSLSISIGSDVRLDGAGRVPPLFLDGGYKVILTDSGGNELRTADPIGLDTDITNFDLWGSSNTYNIPNIVKGSNDLYYQSLADINLNNDPTSSPTFWEQVYFFPTWNTAQNYSSGQVVIASNGRNYMSVVGSNQANDPTLDSGSNWLRIVVESDSASFDEVTIVKLDAEQKGLRFTNDGALRWKLNFDSDESLDINRYDALGVLTDAPLSFSSASGDAVFNNQVAVSDNLSVSSGNLSVSDGNVSFDQDGSAVGFNLNLSSDLLQQNAISFQDAGVDRWIMGQDVGNNFILNRYNSSGVIQALVLSVDNGSDDILLAGNVQFRNTDQGVDVASPNGGSLNFNFPSLGLNTENTAFDFFDNTNTSGDKLINVYQGDGTSTRTLQIDAETGSIHPGFDRIGSDGVKLGKIVLSTLSPSGGEDGDLWLRY